MSPDSTTFVGLDVHKNTIPVAVLVPGRAEVLEWTEAHNAESIRRLARRLLREAPGAVECCYEAGPTGYFLQRKLRSLGVGCTVVAPSLIPVKPGARIKTDRRDARKLGELHRAGLLTEVHPPSETDEAFRDLCRCRGQAQRDLIRAQHRLSVTSQPKVATNRRHREPPDPAGWVASESRAMGGQAISGIGCHPIPAIGSQCDARALSPSRTRNVEARDRIDFGG